jgi:hypothetical protein
MPHPDFLEVRSARGLRGPETEQQRRRYLGFGPKATRLTSEECYTVSTIQ